MKRQYNTILLVDDEPSDLILIERAFRDNGVTGPIHAVNSGAEAIDYLNGVGKFHDRSQFEFPAFILTDLKMPFADGFSVLQTLKSNPEWAVIPTVLLSASGDEDDIKTAYLLGANSYIVKPQNHGDLQEILKHFHDYWEDVEVPRVNTRGEMLKTDPTGKLGARFHPA